MPKNDIFLKFGTCTRNGSFGAFWRKHSQGTFGVKEQDLFLLGQID